MALPCRRKVEMINQMKPQQRKTQTHLLKESLLLPYHQLQRAPPEKIPEIERNTNIKEYLSKKGDLLWILQHRYWRTDHSWVDGFSPWSNKCFRRTYSWHSLFPSNKFFTYKIWHSSKNFDSSESQGGGTWFSMYRSCTWSCNICKCFRSFTKSQ